MNSSTQNANLGNSWKANFWSPVTETVAPTKEFVVKYLDHAPVESHSVVGILSYVMDYPFYDSDDEHTKALMRLGIVMPLHRQLTMQGVKSKIMYGDVVLFDNTLLPLDETDPKAKEELEPIEWTNAPAVEWDLFNDRTLLASLIRNKTLTIMERADVYVVRANETFLAYEQGHCGSCRYIGQDDQGIFCRADLQATSPDAVIGRVCSNFAPRQDKNVAASDEYVLIDHDMVYVPPFTANALYAENEIDGTRLSQLKNRSEKE